AGAGGRSDGETLPALQVLHPDRRHALRPLHVRADPGVARGRPGPDAWSRADGRRTRASASALAPEKDPPSVPRAIGTLGAGAMCSGRETALLCLGRSGGGTRVATARARGATHPPTRQ